MKLYKVLQQQGHHNYITSSIKAVTQQGTQYTTANSTAIHQAVQTAPKGELNYNTNPSY
ncbi:hypothetical protein [Prevotella histicola]